MTSLHEPRHVHTHAHITHTKQMLKKKLKMAKSSVSKAWQPLEQVHSGKVRRHIQFPGDGATQEK